MQNWGLNSVILHLRRDCVTHPLPDWDASFDSWKMFWGSVALGSEILRPSSWLGLGLTAPLGCCKRVGSICSLLSSQCCPETMGNSDGQSWGNTAQCTLSLAWGEGAARNFVCLCQWICAFALILNQISFLVYYSRIWAMDSERENIRYLGSFMKGDEDSCAAMARSYIYAGGITSVFWWEHMFASVLDPC